MNLNTTEVVYVYPSPPDISMQLTHLLLSFILLVMQTKCGVFSHYAFGIN